MVTTEYADVEIFLNECSTNSGVRSFRFVRAQIRFWEGWVEVIGRAVYGDYIRNEEVTIYPARRIMKISKLADTVDLRQFKKS